ncbi:MAG: gliding motility-associated C-terminal domain-containing protein [Chitinophagaceae bacterium]|nr:gliding motility-associated C-terminal domain-containing protein [Chitinophagaceae bacterium]
MKKIFYLLCLLLSTASSYGQQLFYNSTFAGGVTAGGYSPAYNTGGTGNFSINIAPGSTIHKAYFMAGRHGNAAALTVDLNGTSYTFDNTNQVSPTFQSAFYGGNSGVHAIDVTAGINPTVNNYTLIVPNVGGPADRFNDFYLYVEYDNAAMSAVNTAIYVNTQDIANNYTWNMTMPFNFATTSDVGLSLFTGYSCNMTGDEEYVTIAGTAIGAFGGPDVNSSTCGGPIGSFFYENGVLNNLSDDINDLAVNGPDNLSNIASLMTNGSNAFTSSMTGGSGSNAIWALIFVNGGASCLQTASPDTSICLGDSVQISGYGATVYNWSPAAGLSCTNCASPMASPAATTTYTVIMQNTNFAGCIDTEYVTVTVNPVPTVTVSNDTTLCTNTTLQLQASGANYYSWLPGTGLSCTNCPNPVLTPTVTTTFIVVGGNNGCADTAQVTVTYTPLDPIITLSSNNVCLGDAITATADPNPYVNTWIWGDGTPNSSGLNATHTYAAAGTYTISLVNSTTDCTDTATEVVTINALPALVLSNDTAVCLQDSIQLNASGCNTYLWTPATGLSCTTCPDPVLFVTATTTFTVVGSNNGCNDTAQVTVTYAPVASAFTVFPDSVCLGINDQITASSVVNPFNNNWTWGDGATGSGLVVQHTYGAAGTYTVTLITSSNLGCADTSSTTVFIEEAPYLNFYMSDSVICVGEPILFTDTISGTPLNFVWNFGDGSFINDKHSPQHTWDFAGNFQVTLVANYALCPGLNQTRTVDVFEYPVVNLGPDTTICPGITGAITLADINNLNALHNWSTGEQSATIQVTEPGSYWVELDNNGCKTQDTIRILRDCYINIPNSFSPNNDGLNDYFIPRELLSSGVKTFHMNIFNRWGEKIFTTAAIDGRGWDGKYNGVPQPVGVFVYVIEVEFINNVRKNFSGNVTLLR